MFDVKITFIINETVFYFLGYGLQFFFYVYLPQVNRSFV